MVVQQKSRTVGLVLLALSSQFRFSSADALLRGVKARAQQLDTTRGLQNGSQPRDRLRVRVITSNWADSGESYSTTEQPRKEAQNNLEIRERENDSDIIVWMHQEMGFIGWNSYSIGSPLKRFAQASANFSWAGSSDYQGVVKASTVHTRVEMSLRNDRNWAGSTLLMESCDSVDSLTCSPMASACYRSCRDTVRAGDRSMCCRVDSTDSLSWMNRHSKGISLGVLQQVNDVNIIGASVHLDTKIFDENVADIAAWTMQMVEAHEWRPALLFIGGDWNNRPFYQTLGGGNCDQVWQHQFSKSVNETIFRQHMNLHVISDAFSSLTNAYLLDGPRIPALLGKRYLPTYKYDYRAAGGTTNITPDELGANFAQYFPHCHSIKQHNGKQYSSIGVLDSILAIYFPKDLEPAPAMVSDSEANWRASSRSDHLEISMTYTIP